MAYTAISGSSSGRWKNYKTLGNLDDFDTITFIQLPEMTDKNVYIGFFFSSYACGLENVSATLDFDAVKVWLEK